MIGVDSRDGLLQPGTEGYQLTWMDAKVDDWVVTPRREAVEIDSLWYNALRLLGGGSARSRGTRPLRAWLIGGTSIHNPASSGTLKGVICRCD